MSKKKKLNSKNPKYMDNSELSTPVVKKKELIKNKNGVKIYAVWYE